MINIRNLDCRKWAVVALMVLWISTTFSIALMEISFVCALIFWLGWHIQLKGGASSSMSFPHVSSGNLKPGSPIKTFGDDGRGNVNPGKFDWLLWAPLGIFFVFVLASYFTSEYPKESFRGLFKIAKPLLIFFMAANLLRDAGSQKKFTGIFLATFLLVTIDCSIQYAFGKDLLRGFPPGHSGSGIRLVGPFGNFAKMATYLALVIPVFGMRFWSDFVNREYRRRSFYSLVLAGAGLVLLYLTRCRGALIALLLSLICVFIYKRWFKTLGIALVLVLVLLAMVPRGVIIHQDAQGKEQSLIERFELWKRALDVIEAKPWTGTGINTYNVAHAKYDKEQNWRVRGYYAHNGYLQLAAEIGLPGIAFFLLFLFMFFKRALRSIRQVRGSSEEYIQLGFLMSLLAFLIYAAADNNLQSPPSLMMFWFLAGVLMARQINFSTSSNIRSEDEFF